MTFVLLFNFINTKQKEPRKENRISSHHAIDGGFMLTALPWAPHANNLHYTNNGCDLHRKLLA